MADWTNLPEDLLTLVAKRLVHITDYVSFGAVCITWRSVALRNHVCLPTQIPVLMVPQVETHKFYSLTDRKFYNFQVPVYDKQRCRGSDFGWLAIVDDDTFAVSLLNPFSREKKEIKLPPLTQLPIRDNDSIRNSFFLHKVVLSSNPSSTLDFVVLAIFGKWLDLAFCRSGDKAWTSIQRQGLLGHVRDAIFYKQKLYVVDGTGKVMACDVGHPRPCLTEFALPPTSDYDFKIYLAESLGELLQLQITPWLSVDVYKFDWIEGNWVEVESLGEQMLFVGYNTPLSLSASDFPGYKHNCIYLAVSNMPLYSSTQDSYYFGVFNLEDKKAETLCPIDSQLSLVSLPPPIWVLPVL